MFAHKVSAVIGAAFFGIYGWASPAAAQALESPGCAALNGGALDQDADVTGGFPRILAFDFVAGEVITVTITDATDSLAFIDVNDLFDGDTGSQTRAVTLPASGNFNAGSIIDGAGATIRFRCAASGGAAQGILDEAVNVEATAQSVEDSVRILVVPAALATTLGGAPGLTEFFEAPPSDEAERNRDLVRQGVEELRRRVEVADELSEQAEERARTAGTVDDETQQAIDLEQTLRTVEADTLRRYLRAAEEELEDGRFSDAAGSLVAGNVEIGAAAEKNAFFGQRDEATVTRNRTLVRQGLEELRQRATDAAARTEAAEERLSRVDQNDEEARRALTIEVVNLEGDKRRLEGYLIDAENEIGDGNFGEAARSLRASGVDIGAAAHPNAAFDTNSSGGSGASIDNVGETALFSPVNDRTLDFSLDSDFLKQVVSLANGGNGSADTTSGTKFWIKGRVALLDGDRDGADGETAEVLVGAVQRLSSQLEVGAFTGFFTSDLTTNTLATDVETDAFKLGLYGNYLTSNGLRLGLSGAVDFGDTETNRGGVTAQFNYRSYDLSGSVAGATLIDKWVISPSFSGTLSHRRTDKHTDSGGLFIGSRSDTEVIATASMGVSRTFLVDADMVRAISPNVVATGSYFFLGNDDQDDFDHLALTVGGGASIAFQNGANLSMTTGIGGFGQDTMSYSGQLRFTLPF